jgi:hypothetical protein
MPDLPPGVDPDILEDLHTAIGGLTLCRVLQRSTELWEMVQLIRAERAMVRGEVYRYEGLREAYRGAGIARTIVQKLDGIQEKMGPTIASLRKFMSPLPAAPRETESLEFVIAFVMISPKGREAVAKWIADPAAQLDEAAGKIRIITGIVDSYRKALREWRPAPPPPSSPLDHENRPQVSPRFQLLETPIAGPLLPGSAAPAAAAAPSPAPAAPGPAVAVAEAPAPAPASRSSSDTSSVTFILPRGVNPDVLEDVRRVEQCRRIFDETHQEIEVWEVFCIVMLDADPTRTAVERLTVQRKNGERQAFHDGAAALFERLLKVRAQHGKFVRELRAFLGQLPVGSFGKDTMEMALGFIVASSRGRERAQMWLSEPSRFRQEAAGRLEDVISRTMNYQTALRMLTTETS